MKKISLLLLICTFCGLVKAQTSIDVPERLNFAGLELKLNDEVRRQIKADAENLTRNNRYFRMKVERADAYFHIVERIFAEEGLPDDFKYLVLQESGLVSDVVSSSNAVGYWQFKKETAQEMGLRVDDEVDERMNIVASSRAAAKYIKRHNNYMNNWAYALLSYYAGLTGAKSIIDPQYIGVQKMDLDEKTHWYITKFLAHKLAFQNVIHTNPQPPLLVIEYQDCENKSLKDISRETNVALDQIEFYNKWVRNGTVPADKDYTIVFPVKPEEQAGMMALNNRTAPEVKENLKPWKDKPTIFGVELPPILSFIGKKEEKQEPAVDANNTLTSDAPLFFSWNGIKAIEARKGDNIARLALQGGIDKEEFLEYNDLRVFDPVVPGQVYYIKAKKKKAAVPFHTVKEGETLWEISQNYGIRMKHLLAKNRMEKPEKLKAGRILWMRKTRPENKPVEYERIIEKPLIAEPKPAETIITSNLLANDKQQAIVVEQSATPSINNSTSTTTTEVDTPEDSAALSKVEIFVAGNATVSKTKTADPGPAPAEKDPIEALLSENLPTKGTRKFNGEYKTHVLEPGQTLYGIARLYQVNLDSLKAWNDIMEHGLKLGQELYIKVNKPSAATIISAATTQKTPTATAAVPAQPKPTKADTVMPAKPENGHIEYVVKSGDTMYRIARENGITVAQLQEWNNKQSPSVSVGEKLIIKK